MVIVDATSAAAARMGEVFIGGWPGYRWDCSRGLLAAGAMAWRGFDDVV
jgi:hypothetical protein